MPNYSGPGLSNPDGQKLARQLLRPYLTHDIHDYILESVCKAVDGIHVLLMVKTGGGKTGLFYGYILLLHALSELECTNSLLRRKIPGNPVLIIIYPMKGLEEEMERTFQKLGISALAINEDTLAQARSRHENLWDKAATGVSILLLSPEQLSSRSFDLLLQKTSFSARIAALGVDEVHLVLDWGNPGFREAFRHIGLVLARLPCFTTFLGVTATLSARQTKPLIATLGLKSGSFFFNRRSNLRKDIRLVFRVLRHGLGGWQFPDLKWIMEGDRKTIIYCNTISLAFHLFVYLWHSSSTDNRGSLIRLYCSICFPSYNTRTRQLFVEDPRLRVLIATDSLKVGNDFPNVADVVVLNPKDPNDIVQKTGRAGRVRGLVRDPRGVVYVTKAQFDRAKSMVDGNLDQKGKKGAGKTEDEKMSPDLARLIVAPCYPSELNIQFDNPLEDPLCNCNTCRQSPPSQSTVCNCSATGCDPEAELPQLPRLRPQRKGIPMADRITDEMRSFGAQQLEEFRFNIWACAHDTSLRYLPPTIFLPDSVIKNILDNISSITTVEIAATFVQHLWALRGHNDALFAQIQSLQQHFAAISKHWNPKEQRNAATEARSGQVPEISSSSSSVGCFPPTAYDDFFANFDSSQLGSQRPSKSIDMCAESLVLNSTLTPISTNIAKKDTESSLCTKRKFRQMSTEPVRRSKRNKENVYQNS